MLAHQLLLLSAILAQTPDYHATAPSLFDTRVLVFLIGGGTAAILWLVRQAFYIRDIKKDSDAQRSAVNGDDRLGVPGSIPTLKTKVAALEAAGMERAKRLDALELLVATRPWCGDRRREVDGALGTFRESLAHQPSKDSINEAFEQIRGLKEVVNAESLFTRTEMANIRGDLREIKALLVGHTEEEPVRREPTQPHFKIPSKPGGQR